MPNVDLAKLRTLALSLWLHARNLLARTSVTGSGPVVSLTSYGTRVGRVHLTIESIARGRLRPVRLILWLDDPPAPLPLALRRLERRGVEILATEDWGPHKKYFPYCQRWADDGRTLVTADDDVLYPRWWLSRLCQAVARNPGGVWCYRSWRVTFTPDGALAPYKDWPLNTSDVPSLTNLATGVSGVAYPPALQKVLRDAGAGFTEACGRTDDIWLHAHAVQEGVPTGQVTHEPLEFPSQLQSQRSALAVGNRLGGGNDQAIAATYRPEDLAAMRQPSVVK